MVVRNVEVFHKIKNDRLLPPSYWAVYEMLFMRGPLTGRELDTALESESAHKRLAELRLMGVVHKTEARTCAVSKIKAVAWDVTKDLPALRTKTPRRKESPRPNAREVSEAFTEIRQLWQIARSAGVPTSESLVKVAKWLGQGAR